MRGVSALGVGGFEAIPTRRRVGEGGLVWLAKRVFIGLA